jgi:uncharacterized integral membrane protein
VITAGVTFLIPGSTLMSKKGCQVMTDSPQDLEYEQVPSTAGELGSTEAQPAAEAQPVQQEIQRTRASGLWVAIGCFAVLLLLLLIFILQNSHSVDISYFGIHSHLPLGVALLLSAVCGILLVVLAGTARILQLRAAARRYRRADAQATKQAAKDAKQEARRAAKVARPRTPADPAA